MTSGDWRDPDLSGHVPGGPAGAGTTPGWESVVARSYNGSPPPYMVMPSSPASFRPSRRRPVIVAAAVAGALLVLGTGTAFASTAYASDKVCTAIAALGGDSSAADGGDDADGTRDALADAQSDLRLASRMLVMDPELSDAVDGLVADIELMRGDKPDFAEMMTVLASVNTHVREAQQACDLPVTGIFGGTAPELGGGTAAADTEAPATEAPATPAPAATKPTSPPEPPALPEVSEAPSAEVTPDKAGTKVSMASRKGAVKYTLSVAKLRRNERPSQYETARHGMFVSVTVTVQGKKGVTELDTDEFKLVASDGTVYEAESLYSADDEFDAEGLNPGEKTSGKVYFDVPRDLSKRVTVVLKVSAFSGAAAAIWQF